MKITLEFDDKDAADNFVGWWLDGGGEQYLNFKTTEWNNPTNYMRIEGDGITEE